MIFLEIFYSHRKQFVFFLLFFFSFESPSAKVLFNQSTRQVITSQQIQGGATSWTLLDANNSNFSSYTHPAYYNTTVHQVLETSVGSKVGDWILSDAPSALYNQSTKEFITPQQVQSGGTTWTILDANNSNYSNYIHPAYYNTSLHQVLHGSLDSQVGNWVLSVYSYPSQPRDGSGDSVSDGNKSSADNNSSNLSLVLYNTETKEVITPQKVSSGATDWLLLSPEKYPEKYTHPAYYNLKFHRVVENLKSDVENGWTLREGSSIDTNATNPDLSKVLYNTKTFDIITRTDIESGRTNWMVLPAGFVGNDGSTYSFPAYYNKTTHGVLDNSVGGKEGDWILSNLSFEVRVSIAEGGTVTGTGTYDHNETVVLSATPYSGFFFQSWSGDVSSTNNPHSFGLTSSLAVTANFTRDTGDDDKDGLTNYDELNVHSTNPLLADTDADGLSDQQEVSAGMNANSSDKALIDQVSAAVGSRGVSDTPYTEGWFYLPGRGWLFTNKNVYPYLFDSSSKSWLYFQSGANKPRFYHYDTKSWIIIESSD